MSRTRRYVVLVIDDEPEDRALVVEALRGHSYITVTEAEDVESALEVLTLVSVTAILLDWNLDGGGPSGLDAIEALTAKTKAPIIIFSGVDFSRATRDVIQEDYPVAFIHKTELTDSLLAEKIRKIVHARLGMV